MGKLLAQGGGSLLTQGGAHLLTQGGTPAPSALSFPLAPLDLRCELDLGGSWTDVSSYVYQRDGGSAPVTITRGRPDETQTAAPSTCAWQWNNRDGRFSPKNPLGPYYGLLARNTPVRFSVPATSNYLRLEADNSDRAFVQDDTALHVTGSIEVRIGLRLSDWQGCVLAARIDASTPSWYWLLNPDGTLTWSYYDSGGTQRTASSDVPVPYASGDFALKVTLDATSGTLTFYTAASIDGTYAQLGDTVAMTGGAATSVRAGNAPLVVGWTVNGATNNIPHWQLLGRVYEARVYSGIGGTVVADGIFSAQAAGTTSWTDSAGNAWSTAGGAVITSRAYRYHGLMSSQPPKWDVTGRDQYVAAQAGGPLRILAQGTKPPVQSPMKRAILAQSGSYAPVAYWPMEDASGASFFGSATGGPPMTWNGTPTLASDSSFGCSAPLPVMNGAAINGIVPPYAGTGSWAVRFLMNVQSLPGGEQEVFQVDCLGGLAAYIGVFVDASGDMHLTAWDQNVNVVADTGAVAWTGGVLQPLWWSVEVTQSGSDVKYNLVSLQPGASVGYVATVTSTSPGSPGTVATAGPAAEGGWSDLVIGHVQVQSAISSLFSLSGPLGSWNGEAAGSRFARLCTENGWPARIKGSPAVSALMGPQGIDTLPNLLQACETADLGQMHEPREVAGLGYRTLASMLNQSPALTLDYSASEPGGTGSGGGDSGVDPTYDDLLVRNDWTLTRGTASGAQGATVRAALNDGSPMSISVLTDYGSSATVNLEADAQLADVAGWMVHVGTVDEHRWPVIPVNLARTQMAALQAAAMDADAGDLVVITSLPDVVLYDPARQLALGFTEALGGFFWQVQYQAVPASPYTAIVLDDAVLGVLDTDGASLHLTAAYPQSSLSVNTTAGFPVWSTAAGDDPFDIAVSGMRLTVTAVSGSASPQTLTVTPAVNGVQKSLTAATDVRLWTPPVLALA